MKAIMTTPQAALSLVDQMKVSTAKHHRLAERTGVVRGILSKNISVENYALYIRNLHDVYLTLERPLQTSTYTSNLIRSFMNVNVLRGRAIEADLGLIYGSRDWINLPILASCDAYSSAISTLRNQNPIALVGHIYVRYLGDMNGGQVLERLLKQTLDLDNDPYNFYRYPDIVDLPLFRADYREMFNIDGLSATDETDIIDAAVQAFECNIELSKEIMSFE